MSLEKSLQGDPQKSSLISWQKWPILKEGKCHSDLQEWQSMELQGDQPHTLIIPSLKDDETHNCGNYLQANEGQEGNEEQSAWLHQVEVVIDQLL